jgi:hypothetical protein
MGKPPKQSTSTYNVNMMEKENQNLTFTQRLQSLWQDLKQTNLRAQTHYMVFRTTQNIKQKNDLLGSVDVLRAV